MRSDERPTLKGHTWAAPGKFIVGGAKNNSRSVPSLFLLAFLIAEACEWSLDVAATALYCLRRQSSSTADAAFVLKTM